MWLTCGQRLAALVLPLAIGCVAQGQCPYKYQVQTLYGPLCPFTGYAPTNMQAISDSGIACGAIADCAKSGEMIMWDGRQQPVAIPVPPGAVGAGPFAINEHTDIAGIAEIATGQRRGFVYRNGASSLLHTLPNHNWAEAYSIANDGTVVGYSNGGAVLAAVMWQNLQPIMLNLPVGPSSIAYDISDTGYICGWMGVDPYPTFGSRAFVWHRGSTIDLGLVPRSDSIEARGVNNFGQACGGAYFLPPESYIRGFFWSDGRMQEIGAWPGYPHSFAYDLNDWGQVIGRSYNNDLVGPTFIWQNGVMAALDDLIPRELGLSIWLVWEINNAGQVAGVALDKELNQIGVILTPTQPPPGDCDCNGHVGIHDLLNAITQWGPAIPTTTADFDNNGVVNIHDLLILIANWD